MAEILTIAPAQLVRTYEVIALYMNWRTAFIKVTLEASDGSQPYFIYEGDVARNLMTQLNTANLSVSSLHKRILTKLNNDGLLVGPVSGVPV